MSFVCRRRGGNLDRSIYSDDANAIEALEAQGEPCCKTVETCEKDKEPRP